MIGLHISHFLILRSMPLRSKNRSTNDSRNCVLLHFEFVTTGNELGAHTDSLCQKFVLAEQIPAGGGAVSMEWSTVTALHTDSW